MCSCGGCTGKLEVLSYLQKLLDITKSRIQETDSVTIDRFKKIETKMEELQIRTVRELLYREDTATEKLRLVVRDIDGMITGSQDAQLSARLVVRNIDQIDASIDKALAAASETDSLSKRAKRSKAVDKKEGPWGPNLGLDWDMGPLNEIKTIYVSADDRIHSIRFEYKLDDKEYRTPRIGGEGGTIHQIELAADEVIKFVRGGYDTAGLTKLEIITSKQTHSFGKGNGESIVFPPTFKLDCNYKVVGFFGRASSSVNAIGLYMEKCSNCPPDSSP